MGGNQNTAANQMANPVVRISYDEMEAYNYEERRAYFESSSSILNN